MTNSKNFIQEVRDGDVDARLVEFAQAISSRALQIMEDWPSVTTIGDELVALAAEVDAVVCIPEQRERSRQSVFTQQKMARTHELFRMLDDSPEREELRVIFNEAAKKLLHEGFGFPDTNQPVDIFNMEPEDNDA